MRATYYNGLRYFTHNFIILIYTVFQLINIFGKNVDIKYYYTLSLYIIDEVPAKIDYLSEIQTLKSLYFMVCTPDDKAPKFGSLSKSEEAHYANTSRSVCTVR